MTGTSLTEHKTNEAVLDEDNERRTMMNAITKRKVNWTYAKTQSVVHHYHCARE